jgi:NADP-dependent 3-hydroxy acid dehydrogenase YdfG
MRGSETALIVGVGTGLSASLTRLFAREGIRVAPAARRLEKLAALCDEVVGGHAFGCDAGDADRRCRAQTEEHFA